MVRRSRRRAVSARSLFEQVHLPLKRLANVFAVATQLISSRETYYEWKVEARLDAVGIDLAKSRSVTINL